MNIHELDGQLTFLIWGSSSDGPCKAPVKARQKDLSELVSIPYFHLDLSPDHVDLFGNHYWELCSPWREDGPPLNTGPAPRKPVRCSLSDILEPAPDSKYYLSQRACLGILRRSDARGKPLPNPLEAALMVQAGLSSIPTVKSDLKAGHITQNDEEICGCGESIAFAANQREKVNCREAAREAALGREVRDLHDDASTLSAQPGIKQQTLIAGFSAGAGAKAGSIGYSEEIAPTLKGTASGNCMPSILCLNDQGGSVMECSKGISGTLRAQEHGHQPLVLASQQGGAEIDAGVCPTVTAAAGMSGNNQPVLFENHGIDGRYTGPHPVSPTLSARGGTGGNNLPLVADECCICITGNAIDRQPQNGGNGIGIQSDISYTLTATDHHAVFSRQRVDVFKDDDVASTESARQNRSPAAIQRSDCGGERSSSGMSELSPTGGSERYGAWGDAEKRIHDMGFRVRLAGEQDVKRLLAVYYQQDVMTERFDSFDGESAVINDG
ncbi:hypothetical protein [uncultured Dysosmobacter sp.]|uniref:hypothetical protein n=1 Tax=uncultured Dysosmobacter sp. TaxID=2591384 RepID=UPI00260253A9|nr:hypothetical protein [uncultured Dysosmobacter sp.]